MMAKKAALGKGLNALIPHLSTDESTEDSPTGAYREPAPRRQGGVLEIPVDSIAPNPYQPRTSFRDESLEELAASIRELGVIQPLTVRSIGDGEYELISGERRLRASKRAGISRVPAYIREADSEEMLEMAIVENVQREDLNPIEVAFGYQRLIDEIGLTQEEVARKVSKNRSTVTNSLRLLRLPPAVQAALRDGSLTAGHARVLAGIDDERQQLRLFRAIVEEGLSVREVERRARNLRNEGDDKTKPDSSSVLERDRLELRAFETRLRDRLATKVHIRHKNDHSGKIEIAYYSVDDLERVLESLLEG
jgi:ParB family transcriptional regulator, chromosome partitioning protein